MRRIPPILLLLCAVSLFISCLAQFPRQGERFGFPLDDGWIHATYARNLAERGEFAFNPGENSTGTTSLLWTLLLAGVFTITREIVLSAHLLGMGACFLFLLSLYRLTARIFRSRAYGFVAGIAALSSGFTLWWSLSGMETMLFLALGISALESFTGNKLLRAAIFLSLLTLTRPEGALLSILLLIFLIRDRRAASSPPGAILRFAAASLAGALVYAAWNLALTGRLVTSTLAGRRWLANAPIDMPLDPVYYLQKAGGLFVGWSRILTFSYVSQDPRGQVTGGILLALLLVLLFWNPLGRARVAKGASLAAGGAGLILLLLLFMPERSWDGIIDTARQAGSGIQHALVRAFESTGSGLSGKRMRILLTAAGSALLAGGLFIGLFRRSHVPQTPWNIAAVPAARMFFLWLFAHNLLYVIFIPYPGHGGRYQSINIVLMIWLALAGWKMLIDARPLRASMRRLRLLLAAGAAVSLLSAGFYALSSWRIVYFSTVEHINHVHRQTAEWIASRTPRDARIAAFDIGAIGYFSRRRVVDLGGLITPDPIPFMAAGDIDAYIARMRATHLAMVYRFDEQRETRSIAKQLGVASGGKFTCAPIYEARYDSLAWRRNVQVAGNAYPVMIVSKILYPGGGR